jgi:uncharacterized protein YndB with AHSA1/START domain
LANTFTDQYAITITREVNAPRERVWQAFTDPEQVVQWWGPDGFTNTLKEMDVRPGGKWVHIMHGPDGTDYPNDAVFDEVEEPARLAFTHLADVESSFQAFQTVITLEDLGQNTRITLHNRFVSQVEKDRQVKDVGAVEGGKQTLARLAQFVEGELNA